MTRKPTREHKPRRARPKGEPDSWLLQDAKARFSEVVRRAKSEGPQVVTVHGRPEVVVVAVDEFQRLSGDATGKTLIELMRASPLRDVEFARISTRPGVRDVSL